MISKRAMQLGSVLCLVGNVILGTGSEAMAQAKKSPLAITVMTPKAGDTLVMGKSYPVSWSGGYPNESVDIILDDVASWVTVWQVVGKTLKNDGYEDFVVPVVLPGKYRVYVGEPVKAPMHSGYSSPFDIVPPSTDVNVSVNLPGGPKWHLGSQQKAVLTVTADTTASFSEIPVGGVITVRAAMSKGLRVGDGKVRRMSFLSGGRTGWMCAWGAWDSSKPTQVECGLQVLGSPFKNGSFEIPVMPGINDIDQVMKSYRKEDVNAIASLQSPLVDAKQTSALSNNVEIIGINMGIKIPPSNGGKWPVGTDQTLTLQPVLGDILLMKEWIDNSKPMQIYTDLPSNVQFTSATGIGWTCTNSPVGGKTRVECKYAATGTGQISWPKLIESVAVKMKVVSAGDFNLTSHCTVTPKFKLPTLPGKLYEPYTCNYDTTKITN